MNCEAARRLIEQYLDGVISDGDLESLRAHAERCASCRKALAAVDKFAGIIQSAFASKTSPDRALTKVNARLDQESSAKQSKGLLLTGRIHWGRMAALAAMLVAGIAMGFLFDKPPTERHVVTTTPPPPAATSTPEILPAPLSVAKFDGTVLVKREDARAWKEIGRESVLYPGDTVHCMNSSALTLEVDDGSTVDVEANGVMRIGAPKEGIRFDLDYGTLHATVAGGRKPFVVRTPEGEVAALGTQFSVSVR